MTISGPARQVSGVIWAVTFGLAGVFGAVSCANEQDEAVPAATPTPVQTQIPTDEWLARFCAPFISLEDVFQHYDVLVADPPDAPTDAREAYLDLFSHLHAVLEGSSQSFAELGDPPVSDMEPGFGQAMSDATQRAAEGVRDMQMRLEEIEPDDAAAMADFISEMEGTPNPVATAFEDLDDYESAELDAAIGDVPECAILTTDQ